MKGLFSYGTPLLLALLSTTVFGQSGKEVSTFGWEVYSHSLGNAFGVFRNEAGLARFEHFTAGVLAERRFMLDATSVYAFSIVMPLTSGSISLQGAGSGYKDFSQQRIALAYGMPLAAWCDAGIQLDYLNMRIPFYGSAHAFTFGVSMLMHWHDQWTVGVQAFNPPEVKFSKLGEDSIPAVYRLGLGYQPSETFLLSAEVSGSRSLPVQLTTTFHYRIIKHLGLHGGLGTGTERVFFGISIFWKQFDMIFSAAEHPQLGISPGAGLIYENKE